MSTYAVEIPIEENRSSDPASWVPRIITASEIWTNDATVIESLSDPPIIDGLIREKEVASIIGAAKTAKTWFALKLGLSVAQGIPFLGRDTHQRNVLYIDYELKEATLKKRICMLSDDRPEGFFYICLRGQTRLPKPFEITELVKQQGIGLVIIDSLYRTGWQQEENNNDTMSRDLAPLHDFTDNTNASMLIIDHTGKGGGEGRSVVDAARGASAKGGFYDALITLKSFHKPTNPEGSYATVNTAFRDWPGFKKVPLVSFVWSTTSCSIELDGEVDIVVSDSNANRILELLCGSPDAWIPTSQIVSRLELSEATVSKLLKELVEAKKCHTRIDPAHRQRKLYRHKEPDDPSTSDEALRNVGFESVSNPVCAPATTPEEQSPTPPSTSAL